MMEHLGNDSGITQQVLAAMQSGGTQPPPAMNMDSSRQGVHEHGHSVNTHTPSVSAHATPLPPPPSYDTSATLTSSQISPTVFNAMGPAAGQQVPPPTYTPHQISPQGHHSSSSHSYHGNDSPHNSQGYNSDSPQTSQGYSAGASPNPLTPPTAAEVQDLISG